MLSSTEVWYSKVKESQGATEASLKMKFEWKLSIDHESTPVGSPKYSGWITVGQYSGWITKVLRLDHESTPVGSLSRRS
jgi:hypothetical protein